MPKQTRWDIKRGMDQAINDLNRAQENLIFEGARFEDHKSDFYGKFKALVQAVEAIKKATIELKDSI